MGRIEKQNQTEPRYNITVIGAPGVGKSALSLQFLYQEFVEDYEPTKVDSYQTYVRHERSDVNVQITDTAGQEDYASVRDTFLRNGEGFLCVFSLTDTDSFSHVQELYSQVKLSKGSAPPHLPFLLVGNKCDVEASRQISLSAAVQLARNLGVPYIETSAKTNFNVTEAFLGLTKMVVNSREPLLEIRDKGYKKKGKFGGFKKYLCGLS